MNVELMSYFSYPSDGQTVISAKAGVQHARTNLSLFLWIPLRLNRRVTRELQQEDICYAVLDENDREGCAQSEDEMLGRRSRSMALTHGA